MKNKLGKKFAAIFMIAAFLFSMLAGSSTKASIFQKEKERVEIFPLATEGDWDNDFRAMFLPEAGEKDGIGSFNSSNSAVYKGGAKDMILSDFGATRA